MLNPDVRHRRRRQCRRGAGREAVGRSGSPRPAGRSRRGHTAGCRACRHRGRVSDVVAELRLLLARPDGAAPAGRAALSVPTGPHHGRRLQHHGHVGAARRAFGFRGVGRGRCRRLGTCEACLYYRKLENDLDRDAATRRRRGPTPSVVCLRREWPPLPPRWNAPRARLVCRHRRHQRKPDGGLLPDAGEPERDGALVERQRLSRRARFAARPNLRIMTQTRARRSVSTSTRLRRDAASRQ